MNFLTLMDCEKIMKDEILKRNMMPYNNPRVFLKISQNSHGNTCTRVSHLKPQLATLLKKRLWDRRFPVSFAKFSRTPFFIEHLWVTVSDSH